MFLSGFIILSFLTTIYSHQHECVTPNSTVGICKPLSQCPRLQKVFEEVTAENYVFLRRSQCGYSDNEPEVCCQTSTEYRPFKLKEEVPERFPRVPLGDRFGATLLPEPPDCGIQSYDNRIFGGEITAIDEFPWMALLEYARKGPQGHGFACGGVLINSQFVLTAAHCAKGAIESALGGLVSVRLGEHNVESDIDCDAVNPRDCAPAPIDVKIAKKIVHPDYQPDSRDQYHDIALLKLAEPVEFTDFISPICLAKDITSSLFSSGKLHFVSGWGQTEKNRNSPVKLKLKVPIVPSDSCTKTYNPFKIRIGRSQLCAGGQSKKDSCGGDSGGPLAVPAKIPAEGTVWFCSGIVSIGPSPCASKNIPGIYTKVTDYYDWIIANLK